MKKGVLLLEVLVGILIFGIIIGAIYSVLALGSRISSNDVGVLRVQKNVRQALKWLTQELREASSFSITNIDSDHDSITFSNPSGNIFSYYIDQTDINGDSVVDQVIREFPAGSRRVVANNITRLKFSPSGNLLVIDVRGDVSVRGDTFTYSLSEQLSLRN